MATIYSNRNDGVGSHTTVDINTGATWAGGAVPTRADQVYIVGRRTTINQSAFDKWAGTRTITVASTTNFATSGFFYTTTSRNEIVKINYTGTTSVTFTGCSIDESDPFYAWSDYAGTAALAQIPNGAYVHNPAYIIEIGPGESFICNELIITEGGWLYINGGELIVKQGIIMRDGRLVGRSNGTNKGIITIDRQAGTNSSSDYFMGYLTAENYPLSVIDIDGGEVRSNSTLASDMARGDGSLTVQTGDGVKFVAGDEIAVYKYDDYRRMNKGYLGYLDYSCSFKDMDEGFDVAGVSGDIIYVAMRNGTRGDIKAVETVGSQKVLNVDTKDSYFLAGDSIVINNKIYTIDSVEDSQFQLYSYDFTNPATSLSDFWVDDATHIYSAGWTIESGVGLKSTSGSYREFVHKYCWRREIIVDAYMSPLTAFYSGTRGTAAFGLLTAYDPAYRWGHRGYDSVKSDYLIIDDANDKINFDIRAMTAYENNRLSRNSAFRELIRGPCHYKIDTRKARTTVYIEDKEITTEQRRDGNFKGLCGIYTNGNTSLRVASLTLSTPTQKLYITTTDSFSITGDASKVYKTGCEIPHATGDRIIKISSINKGLGNHTDLAFAYRGQNGNGEWPIIRGVDGLTTTNNAAPYLHNHDLNVDYYINLGNSTSEQIVVLDLGSQKTFTHISYSPRFADYSTYYGMNGIAVYGSNDATNWTTLYGPQNDSRKWYYASYNRLGFYPTGSVSYRYIKFGMAGAQHASYATNRPINIGVHNFDGGNYTLSVNNASDLNIGDTITVLTDTGYSRGSCEIEAYYAAISNGADPEVFWHGGWLPECIIINKIGNLLYLDRPIFWGYLEDEDSAVIVKTNRNFIIRGTFESCPTFSGYITTAANTSTIIGLEKTSHLTQGMYLNKVSGNGVLGTDTYISSIDSSTQITVTGSTAMTVGSIMATQIYKGNITSSATTSTITGLPSTTGLKIGQYLSKINGAGVLGNNCYISSIDSSTQVTVTAAATMTAGTIVFDLRAYNNWRWPNITMNSGSYCKKYLFRNLRANYIGTYRSYGASSYNRGWINYSYDYWNMPVLDGVVHMMGPDGTTWAGNFGSYYSMSIQRNCVAIGGYSAYWVYYYRDRQNCAFFNNKIAHCIYGLYGMVGPNAFAFNYNEVATCETGASFNTYDADRLTIPFVNEIRRNYFSGSSYTGISMASETYSPFRYSRTKVEYNKARGQDDYATSTGTYSASPQLYSNYMSDHTGARISRYRNEGWSLSGAANPLAFRGLQKNFNRFGYDLAFGIYHTSEKLYTQPDILRIYTYTTNVYYPMFGIELDILEDVPFQVMIQFAYKYPLIARLQDDGTDDGRLRFSAIQHATLKETVYGTVPSSLGEGWATFSYIFSSFAAEEGKAGVYLGRAAENSYVDFTNLSAYVLTDYPDKVKVIANTFDINRFWDPYGEYYSVRPLSAFSGTNTAKFLKVKF